MQPTSRGRLRSLRGGGWEEIRQFSQPDASAGVTRSGRRRSRRPLAESSPSEGKLAPLFRTYITRRTSPRKQGCSLGGHVGTVR